MTGPKALLGAPGALLVIISGPSGVGKDTIIDALRDRPREPDYHYVVTCTTRAPRPGEVPGVSYQFLTRAQFRDLREAGELLEANEVHGNWYGTPRREVAAALVGRGPLRVGRMLLALGGVAVFLMLVRLISMLWAFVLGFLVFGEVPKTSTGKIQKFKLREVAKDV